MTGHEISVSRDVLASPQVVWDVLTDLDHAEQTISGIVSVDRLGGEEGSYDVGTRWRETRRMFGKEESMELYVTVVEPPRLSVVEADYQGVHYTTRFELTPKGTGTELSMTFAADQPEAGAVKRITWSVLGRVGAEVTRRICKRDLADIAAVAQRRDSAGPAEHPGPRSGS